MQDENIKKMAEMATPLLTDISSINILICDLLYRLKKKITRGQLYDILVSSEIVSYFFYLDSIEYLIKTGSLEENIIDLQDPDKNEIELTAQGETCAKELRNYISKIYRDKAVITALIYFTKEKFKNQLKIDYIKDDSGYYVHIRCIEKTSDLMDLKFHVSTIEQAKFLGSKVMRNPKDFYNKIFASFDTSELLYGAELIDE